MVTMYYAVGIAIVGMPNLVMLALVRYPHFECWPYLVRYIGIFQKIQKRWPWSDIHQC